MTTAALVCVADVGRSQMATAFAGREREQRGLDKTLEIVTGGIDSHDHVHDDVIKRLREERIDINNRTPRQTTAADVADAAYTVRVGCSVEEFVPDDWDGTAERWELERPGGDSPDAARDQRDGTRRRVEEFLDRIRLSNE